MSFNGSKAAKLISIQTDSNGITRDAEKKYLKL